MLKPERQAWLMVAVLFATLTFIFGGTIATPGVFFAPPYPGIRLEPCAGLFAGKFAHAWRGSRQRARRLSARKG
jgi:hypothetical protein